VGDSAAEDKLEQRVIAPEGQAIKSAGAQEAGNAGASEMQTIEARRTNASTGSLQERRRFLTGQGESVEIVGLGAVASRQSRSKVSACWTRACSCCRWSE
jgi:hypothetical protein